jgi:hypothetical protein
MPTRNKIVKRKFRRKNTMKLRNKGGAGETPAQNPLLINELKEKLKARKNEGLNEANEEAELRADKDAKLRADKNAKLPAISTLGKTEDETRKEQRLRLEKLKTQAQQDSLTSTECKELSKMIKESTLHYTDTVNEWRNQITQSSAPNSRGGRSKKRKRKSKKRKSKKR